MKKFVFRDQQTHKTYIIPIISGPEIDEDFIYDRVNPAIEERELETRYGVHDFNTEGPDEAFGYTTYEVEDWAGLMKEWEGVLTALGFEIGDLLIEDDREEWKWEHDPVNGKWKLRKVPRAINGDSI